jgi:nicotinate-nucleotide adenylyltransferase
MRVALFGGSFNPPHVAHQLAALYVLETAPVDQLWLIPCFRHPFEKALERFEDRLRMCELMAASLGDRVKVSDIEARLGGESRTLHTVRALQAEHPDTEFQVVIGSDLVDETNRWFGAEELRQRTSFLVVGRSGAEGEEPGLDHEDRVNMPAISSTDVRERLQSGRPADHLVPRRVLDYIRERGLYGVARPL